MARNAELERQLAATGDCDAAAYDESPEGRRWAALQESIVEAQSDLDVLRRAAGFNPKAPLTTEV